MLLLGQFTNGRKDVPREAAGQAQGDPARRHRVRLDRAPVRDLDEMIQLLANMSVFIIADLTGPRSVSAELNTIVPRLAIPMVPIIQEAECPYALFDALMKYPWVLEPLVYDSPENLIARD